MPENNFSKAKALIGELVKKLEQKTYDKNDAGGYIFVGGIPEFLVPFIRRNKALNIVGDQ